MDAGALREHVETAPDEPGVYQFFAGDTALYIGKAVDLRARLRSYLTPRSERIDRMVARADRVETAVTDTETQALLLEANLIKRHQPRYNVRLTDDKSYPLVQFTDHAVPRIEVTRDPEPGAQVYGPFTDRRRLDAVVKALRYEFGLRGCSDHKFANRDRPCLDHELGLCAAPCTGEIDVDTYRDRVATAMRLFEGETGVLAGPIREAMDAAARDHEFERAANLRDRLDAVQRLHGGGEAAIAAPGEERTLDVLGVAMQGDTAVIARLHSEAGQLVDRTRRTMTAPDVGEDHIADVIGAFIAQYYADRPLPDAVLVQELPGDEELLEWLAAEGVDLRVPAAGRDRTLLDLALKNADRGAAVGGDPLAALADRLHIAVPSRIEGLDVSHAQGRAVVGSNVAFADGSPQTDHYRRKKLDEGNDDVGRMRQLAQWRIERSIAGRDARPDPDVLLVDGGAVQRDAVADVVDTYGWPVETIALAKGEETVVTAAGAQSWPDDDPALHLLQRVRDEAHRFAVSYHQTVRDRVETVLDDVDGIGPTRRRRLLRRFGSLEGIRSATPDELREVPGIGRETVDALGARL